MFILFTVRIIFEFDHQDLESSFEQIEICTS